MADEYLKFAHGKKEDIPQALEEGKIDEKDMIVTEDTDELYYIDVDKNVHLIGARTLTFESTEEAIESLNDSDSTYAGQIVMVMDDNGDYQQYIVQSNGENTGYIIEPVQAEVAGLTWTEF